MINAGFSGSAWMLSSLWKGGGSHPGSAPYIWLKLRVLTLTLALNMSDIDILHTPLQ